MGREKGLPSPEAKIPIGGRKAFTLIELLVVISVIVLLMALLLPALQKARRQSKTTFCQVNLHQWGTAFNGYANDHDGHLPEDLPRGGVADLVWPHALRSHYSDSNDALLCPEAPTPWLRADNPFPTSGSTQRILGSTAAAWEYCWRFGKRPTVHFIGSYGINWFITEFSSDRRYQRRVPNNHVPVLLDCVYMNGAPWSTDDPPEFEDDISGSDDMKYFCVNRHDGGINGLFMDWSARKVGLKELWTLRWNSYFPVTLISRSPRTTAGGVQPEDWPAWMRGFKEY